MEICLSGGAHRGIYELGSLKALEESGILIRSNLKKAIGTSIGAVILCAYIVGQSADDICDIVCSTDILTFAEMSLQDSIYDITILKNWIINLIKVKCSDINDMTTLEFYNRYGTTFITSTVSLECGLEYISHLTEPSMKIVDQLISTVSIPFMFKPHQIICNGITKTYVDGCVLDNFPVSLFDKSLENIGIIVKSKKTPYVHTGDTFMYVKRILELINRTTFINDNTIILDIDDDTVTVNFNLSLDDKVHMFKTGYNMTIDSPIYNMFILKRHKQMFEKTKTDLTKI
jgi:predicted acylesterase/phospholipase RssA